MFNVHKKNFVLLVKSDQQNEQLQVELDLIEQLVRPFMRLDAVENYVEIADLNVSQLISKGSQLKNALSNYSPDKAFVFLIGKN
ncbi:MAG TPA: hypothetical protein VLC98_13280 [Phnomibacter sp.]|nr:hypothetical protein [Phnomibacter sp.]